jgi:hypothetical protein
MSTWRSHPSMSLSVVALAGWRAMHLKAVSLVRPSALRRAQTRMVRLITVVAGH